MPLRYHIETNDGLLRLSLEFMEHKRPLRQLTGQSIKVVEVFYSRSGDCIRLHRAWGMFGSVDGNGFLSEANSEALAAAVALADSQARAKRMRVPDIGVIRKRQIAFDKHRWKPTSAQLESIMADLTGAKLIPLASRRRTNTLA